MRNLKDIICERLNISNNVLIERLVLSKNKKTNLPTIEEFNKACLDYIERVTKGYPEFKINMFDLPAYSECKSLDNIDKLPIIDLERNNTTLAFATGQMYMQSIQYSEDRRRAPICINYYSKNEFDKGDYKKKGIQLYNTHIKIDQLFKILDDNVLSELYEYIITAERE